MYSNTTTDFLSVSRLFDGVLNFPIWTARTSPTRNPRPLCRFGSSSVVCQRGEAATTLDAPLTGNVDIFYSPDNRTSFVPVLNPNYHEFDSQQTRFNEEIHITFDAVNTDRIRLTIHALDGSLQVGLANMSVVRTNTNIKGTPTSRSKGANVLRDIVKRQAASQVRCAQRRRLFRPHGHTGNVRTHTCVRLAC